MKRMKVDINESDIKHPEEPETRTKASIYNSLQARFLELIRKS